MASAESSKLTQRGVLKAHTNWVTALATSAECPDMLISASRDKSLIQWKITRQEGEFGVPHKRLTGHSHFVSDVAVSSDGQFALSGSWDGTLRLWDLQQGKSTRRFVGHTKDILSVAFSADNRQIVSGARDKTINLWNTLGECKYTIREEGHSEWVSCVRFSSDAQQPLIVSAGCDKLVKVWNLQTCKLRNNLIGHTGYVNTVAISPDGSLCASGGKDGIAMLWDLKEGKHLNSLPAGNTIHAMCFSPTKYWLCVAAGSVIRIFDLESKDQVQEIVAEDIPVKEKSKALPIEVTSLAWNADGTMLFAGYTDNNIRVFAL